MQEFSIIEQLNEVQIKQLFELFRQTWWAHDRPMEDISIMLKNSMSFGLIENETQNLIGYARVITDEIKYAFIFDVMVVEQLRRRGLGKMLMQRIINHPRFKKVKNFELTCAPDMVTYYEKFGFSRNYGDQANPMRYSRAIK